MRIRGAVPADASDGCPACQVKTRQLAVYTGGVASLRAWVAGPGAKLARHHLAAELQSRLAAIAAQAQKGGY